MLANMDDNASKRISLEKVADRYLNGWRKWSPETGVLEFGKRMVS